MYIQNGIKPSTATSASNPKPTAVQSISGAVEISPFPFFPGWVSPKAGVKARAGEFLVSPKLRYAENGAGFIPEQRIVASKAFLGVDKQIAKDGFYNLYLDRDSILGKYASCQRSEEVAHYT